MANVSLSMTAANIEDVGPLNITTGTNAPGAGDIEIRVNTANITSLKQLWLALEKFDWFVQDEGLGPTTFGML